MIYKGAPAGGTLGSFLQNWQLRARWHEKPGAAAGRLTQSRRISNLYQIAVQCTRIILHDGAELGVPSRKLLHGTFRLTPEH
jgi:hypothetical protein